MSPLQSTLFNLVKRLGAIALLLMLSIVPAACYEQSDSVAPADGGTRSIDSPVQLSQAGAQMSGEGAAQQRLPEFRTALEKRDPRYKQYYVCIRGSTPEGATYAAWYNNVRFQGNFVKGRAFHPPGIQGIDIQHGSEMSTSADQIIDWIMVDTSNKVVGGFTIQQQRSRMTPQEHAKFDANWKVKFE